MAFTHVKGVTYKNDAGTIASVTNTYTGNAEANLELSVAASTTNGEHDLVFTAASIVSLCIYATAALTIKTNSTSAPDDTIALAAGEAITWASGDSATSPFTVDVTKLYITNASSTVASTLKIRVLHNL